MKHLKILFIILFFCSPSSFAETVTIIYQNDIHGWVYPASDHVGLMKVANVLRSVFEKEPSSFYAVSGDIFTGPNFPNSMRGKAPLKLWNLFYSRLRMQGYGERILISVGNHEFDYGIVRPEAFSNGLLCANILDTKDMPFYVPYKVITTHEGLRIGFLGLLLEGNRKVNKVLEQQQLKVIPMIDAVERFLPEMGYLNLTVLMIHASIKEIVNLAQSLPHKWGVDVILSGHDHFIFEEPLKINGIYIFQAGAINRYYGKVDLDLCNGSIKSIKNHIVALKPDPLEYHSMVIKEAVDELNGQQIALLKNSLTGAFLRYRENSLGDFVTDAFRWITGADIAMTNSSSLRRDLMVWHNEPLILRSGDFKTITPFGNKLMVGTLKGFQIRKIVEGEVQCFCNQISGLSYTVDMKRPAGKRIISIRVGGKPLVMDKTYTLVHNSYCTRPENMERYLHLPPNSVTWKSTELIDFQALEAYAKHLGVINYPTQGKGRIVVKGQGEKPFPCFCGRNNYGKEYY